MRASKKGLLRAASCVLMGWLFFATARAATPELVIQNQVASNATSYSPDGRLLASVGSWMGPGVLQIWDLSTGKVLRELATKGGMVAGVAFLSGGSSIATCCEDGGAELWDVGTGERRRVLSKTGCKTISASPDGRAVALSGENYESGRYKSFIQVVRVADGRVSRTFEIGMPLSVAFSPNGKNLIAGGVGHEIRVWDVESGRQKLELKGHEGQVHSVSVSADGTLLASSDGETFRTWNLNTGTPVRVAKVKNRGVHFGPVGRTLYVGVIGSTPGDEHRLEDGLTGARIATLGGPFLLGKGAAFSPDGGVLAVAGITSGQGNMPGGIQFWNLRTGKFLREFRSDVTTSSDVAFSPRGQLLAVLGGNGVRLWNLQTLRPVPLANPEKTDCNSGDGLEFVPSSDTLIAGIRCGRLDIMSTKGEPLRVLRPPVAAFIRSFSISPDGSTVVANTPNCMGRGAKCQTGYVAWNLASGSVLWTYPAEGFRNGVKPAFSSDGRFVAIGQQHLVVLDARSGALVKQRELHHLGFEFMTAEPYAVAFAGDGRLAAGSSFNDIVELASATDEVGKRLTRCSLENRNGDSSADRFTQLRYSQDGQILFAARADGMLLQLRGTVQREARVHSGAITSVDLSPDGRLLATAGQDAAVRIWDIGTFRLLATLVQVGDSEYIFAAPSGAYTASPGAFAGVAFRAEGRVYPFEQFDVQLNRPDLVLSSLRTGSLAQVEVYRKAWLSRLKRMGVDERNLSADYHTPSVTLLTGSNEISTGNRILNIRVRAEDIVVPLDRLKVVVNDVPLWGARGRSLEKRTGAVEVPVQVELSTGVNRIRISAINAHSAESPSETIEIVYEAPPTQPDTYLLAIGVSKYRADAYNLQYAAKDAADVADLFEQAERASSVKVMRILDGDATRERILSARSFLSRARVDDKVIVFAAGHGLLDNRLDYYFATADIDFEHPEKRGLPFQAFEDLLDGIPSRNKLLLVDTCNSGEVDPEAVAVAAPRKVEEGTVRARAVRGVRVLRPGVDADGSRQVLSDLFRDLRRGSGAAIISSAGGAEFAFESERWRNGVFTYSMLNGLRTGSADSDGDGRVRVSELRDYVVSSVQRLTGGAQRPTSRRESLEYDFEVTSQDHSLQSLLGVKWESPALCQGAADSAQCECLVRAAKKRFATPRDWLDATSKYAYASKHGHGALPEQTVVREVFGECFDPANATGAAPYVRGATMVPGSGGPCALGMARLGPASSGEVREGAPRAFCLDATEVTVSDFKRCVASGACISANAKCDPFANYGVAGKDLHPMNCVDVVDAEDYCSWAGKRLPSQLEWGWAAHGGDRQTAYPWGNDPPHGDICWQRGAGPQSAWLGTCPVGNSKVDLTPQGVHDLGGNVGEWTSTLGADAKSRIIVGGGWADDDANTGMSAEWSMAMDRTRRHGVLGFRCARNAGSEEGGPASTKKESDFGRTR